MARTNPEDVAGKLRDALTALERHDVEPYIAMMAPDFEVQDPTSPEPLRGREVVRKVNEGFAEAMPDLASKILSTAVGPDVVAVELQVSGTFKGPLKFPQGTIPPTGRHFEFTYAAFYRFNSEGLLTSVRNYGSDIGKVLGITG